MRRQDEIRLHFPGEDARSQKLLLCELDGYAQAFDAEETYEFLLSVAANSEDLVHRQAIVTISLFLPRFVASRMGELATLAGVWSMAPGYANDAQVKELDPTQIIARDRLRAAAVDALAPLGKKIADRLKALTGFTADTARLGLAFLGSDAALDALIADVRLTKGSFESLWAFAFGGGARRDKQVMIELLERHGWRHPDLLLAATPLEIDPLREVSNRLKGRLDWLGMSNLALALARNEKVDPTADLEPLIAGSNGWTQVYILRALAYSRRGSALPLIRRLHASTNHAFVRQQALRAAGAINSQDAIDFCLTQAEQGNGPEVAQAIESLVSLRCPRSDLENVAKKHLTSANLRTRVNAMLAVHDPQSPEWPAGFEDLLRSTDTLSRLEAAFCMGYWQNRPSLRALALQATGDGSPAVRQQAIKSLSKYQTVQAYPMLAHLLKSAPPAEAQTALRVLSRLGADQPGPIADFLMKEIADPKNQARRAMLVRALAAHGAATGHVGGETALSDALNSSDRGVQAAALNGIKYIPEALRGNTLTTIRKLFKDPHPEVWAPAAVAGFLGGDLTSLDRLSEHVSSSDPERVSRAVFAFHELVLISTEVVGLAHDGLARALARSAAMAEKQPRQGVTQRWIPVVAGRPGAPALDEGEFPAPAGLTAPPPAAPVDLAKPTDGGNAAISDVLADLKKRYEAPDNKKAQVDLARDNYMVAGRDKAAAMTHEPTGLVAARRARQVVLFLRQNPVLLLPFVAFAVVAVVVLRSVTAPPPKLDLPPPVALTVVTVKGKAAGDDTQVLLGAGDVVRAGKNLKLAPGAAATLVTDGGDRVAVKEESRMGVVLEPNTGFLVLGLAEGHVDVAASQGRKVAVTWNDYRIEGTGARFTAVAVPGKLTVKALDPGVQFQRPGSSASPLEPGKEVYAP